MGFKKIHKRNRIEVEPTAIDIFNLSKVDKNSSSTFMNVENETELIGKSLNPFKWTKDYLNEPSVDEVLNTQGLAEYWKELLSGDMEPNRLKSMLESIKRHQDAYKSGMITTKTSLDTIIKMAETLDPDYPIEENYQVVRAAKTATNFRTAQELL